MNIAQNRIISLARSGDKRACEMLIDLIYPTVEPIVRKNLPPGEEKQDLLQEIFMKVFSKIHQFSGKKPITHWASRIAVNTCYDRLRRKKSRPELVYGDLAIRTAQKPKTPFTRKSKGTEGELINELIEVLISTLTAQERTAIRLLELKEKTVKEVCEVTGWSESKVKVTKMRAQRKLQLALAELEKDSFTSLHSGICN